VSGISLNSNGVTEPFSYAITNVVFAACRRIVTEDAVYAEGGRIVTEDGVYAESGRIDAAFRSLNA